MKIYAGDKDIRVEFENTDVFYNNGSVASLIWYDKSIFDKVVLILPPPEAEGFLIGNLSNDDYKELNKVVKDKLNEIRLRHAPRGLR